MKLTGPQFGAIQDALLDAFDMDGLRRMAYRHLDNLDLERVAGPGNRDKVVEELIKWAEREDKVNALLDGACAANNNNVHLQSVRRQAQEEQWFDEGPAAAGSTSPTGGSLRAVNVAVGGAQIIVVDGRRIEVPSREAVLAYAAAVQEAHKRWADRPDEPEPPLYAQSDDAETGPDAFIPMRALPMRLARFRPQPGGGPEPAVDLLEAVGGAQRTIILGEPGSGKSSALERLAWVMASETLARAAAKPDAPLTVLILAKLTGYRGDADLISLLRTALNRYDTWQLGDASVRVLLWANNVRCVLLLDGLNELDRDRTEDGRRAIRLHLDDYPRHVVHLTCRTADFDNVAEENPERRVLPGAVLWTVQELADEIRHWDDDGGHSDVRNYLRRHLGNSQGKRLYEHLRGDDRLADMARIPLFLWMFKEAAGRQQGDLPSDRGELLHGFVTAPHLLGRVPKAERTAAERSLECVGWRMQNDGVLVLGGDALDEALVEARGVHGYDLDAMRGRLLASGLLKEAGKEGIEFLHQLVQEYEAAAYLLRRDPKGERLPELARRSDWRETCIAGLWLNHGLHEPAYLFGLMNDAAVDLRVRVAAATVLAEVGDPRFVRRAAAGGVAVIEPPTVRVPAGDAVLGGEDPEGDSDELPECRVSVAAFDLAVYPVTNLEYRCFVDAGGYADESLWTSAGKAWLRGEGKLDAETEAQYRRWYQDIASDVEAYLAWLKERGHAVSEELVDWYREVAGSWTEQEFVDAYAGQILGQVRRQPVFWEDSRFNGDNGPVVGVNWYEAMAYAAWLSRATGRAYRLPTEAEWEWAARRGVRRYPWEGDWDPERCNWSGSRLNRPNPVGVYPQGATPDGLHELAGNVYEWTSSLYRPYPYKRGDGREDPEADGLRVARGGSWYTGRTYVRGGSRDGNGPWIGDGHWGFRLARASSL